MSILIIGDDRNNEIQKLYQSYGAYNTQYWSNCECFESLPENINGLVLLQDKDKLYKIHCKMPIPIHHF